MVNEVKKRGPALKIQNVELSVLYRSLTEIISNHWNIKYSYCALGKLK